MPGLDQPVLERLEVLDDAVVDDRDAAFAIEVWMGVLVGGAAVGGPARVAHADLADRPFAFTERRLELRELAGPLDHPYRAIKDGDPSGVIAAVLEASKALQEDWEGLVGADIAHDAAHEGSMVPRGLR